MLHRPRAWKSDPRDESCGHISLVAMTPGWKHTTEEASPPIFRATLAKRRGSHYHQRCMMIISDVLSLSTPRRRRNAVIKNSFPSAVFDNNIGRISKDFPLRHERAVANESVNSLRPDGFHYYACKNERKKHDCCRFLTVFFCFYNNLICSWREFFSS